MKWKFFLNRTQCINDFVIDFEDDELTIEEMQSEAVSIVKSKFADSDWRSDDDDYSVYWMVRMEEDNA